MVPAGDTHKTSFHLALNASTFWPWERATDIVLVSLWLPYTQDIDYRHNHSCTCCVNSTEPHTSEITIGKIVSWEANLSIPWYGLSLPSVKRAKEQCAFMSMPLYGLNSSSMRFTINTLREGSGLVSMCIHVFDSWFWWALSMRDWSGTRKQP